MEASSINPRSQSAFAADLFRSTSVSVVTESDFTSGDVLRVTEKSLTALACGHDFLMVGNPFTLQLLKRMGFDLNSPTFSQAYDQEKDVFSRMKLIENELIGVSSLSLSELE